MSGFAKFEIEFEPPSVGTFNNSIVFYYNADGIDIVAYIKDEGIDISTTGV